MDDEIQTNGGGSLGDDFYETIEAPKFVDLTKPDRCRPDNDDRYWFCLRVGCDQKHEEEMDSEAIYKNFVLRVMAARSPNVRLRKVLYGKDPRNVKCPHSVPAKSSKSRVSRLALVSSSISQKVVDGKMKERPLFKQRETPQKKENQSSVAAKALTTPQNKKRLSNLGAFRSVRNPKPTAVAAPKNRMVAKALVFHSPKKTVGLNLKKSVELRSSVRKLCAGMKNLEITGGKKNVSGCDRQLPGDASRKQIRGREVKSRVYDSLRPQNCQGKDAKSLFRCLKKKNEERELLLHCGPVPCEETENESSDMEIEEKSRNGSLEDCSVSDTLKSSEINEHEDGSETQKTSKIQLVQNKGEAMLDTSGSEGTSLVKRKEKNIGEKDVAYFQVQNGEHDETNEKSSAEEQVKLSPEKGIILNILETDENEDASVSDDKENEGKIINYHDKENASASNDSGKLNPNTSDMGKNKILSKNEAPRGTLKVSKEVNKMVKGNSTSAVTCDEGVNYRKPKLTNPKPFRLRTDERQILKEANLEKKLHLNEPLQEIVTKRIQHHAVQRNVKCLEQLDPASDAHEGSEKESARRVRKDQPQRRGTSCPHNSKAAAERKESTTPQGNTISLHQKSNLAPALQESSKGKVAKKSEESFKRTKSLLVIQLETTLGVKPGKKKTFSPTPGQLGVIKESSPTILRTMVVTKPIKNGASLAAKPSASYAARPSLLGRKPATIPKEPHFHNVHVPKRCTKRAAI